MIEDQLLAAVLDDPESDAPRLAYAADADRRGDPRGELIRLQIERRDAAKEGRRTAETWNRIKTLLALHEQEWVAPVVGLVKEARIIRGFVEHVRLDAAVFLACADEMFARAPIRHLTLEGCPAVATQLAASNHLLRLVTLDLANNHIGDNALIALLRSPYLWRVRALHLGWNEITRVGVEALAASDALPALEYISLTANRVDDPVEEYSEDGSTHKIIKTSVSLPPLGRELSARYGYKKWLHAPSLLPIYPLLPIDM